MQKRWFFDFVKIVDDNRRDSYKIHNPEIQPRVITLMLANNSAIWNETFDLLDDIVTIQDKNFTIIRGNKAAEKFLPSKETNIRGQKCYQMFAGTTAPCVNCPLLISRETGEQHSTLINHKNLKKTFKVISSRTTANIHGEEHLVHIARDITKSIESEDVLQESNALFSKVFDSNPVPVIISEVDTGLFIDANQRWIETIGYSKEELIGKTSKEIGIWQDPTMRDAGIELLREEGSLTNFPITFLSKSGDLRSSLWSAEKITIKGQELLLTHIHDITEQKLAFDKWQQSEAKFNLTFHSNPDAISISNLDTGKYVEMNVGFTKLTGYTADDITGKSSHDINIWNNTEDLERFKTLLNQQGYCENFEAKFRRQDGCIKSGLMSARVVFLDNAPHVIATVKDISDLKRTEQKVNEQKALFETMFNAIDDAIAITDKNHIILFANQGMEKHFGYHPEELKNSLAHKLYAQGDIGTRTETNIFHRNTDREGEQYVTNYKHKSGREFPGETFRVKLYDQEKKWIGYLAIMRDVTQRLLVEKERDRLIAAIEQTNDAIVITDNQGNIQFANSATELVTGYSQEELLGNNPRVLKSGEHDPQFYEDMWQILTSGATFKGRIINKHKSGKLFTEEATISPIFDSKKQIANFVAVKRDITEQLQLENQLHQAQKMEAVGRLTGGVAHDFNNILGVIMGYSEMALEDVSPQDPLHDSLETILDAANRSADIVRQLLAFSRKQTICPKVIDLNNAVTGMHKMLNRLIGESINLSWEPAQEPLLIKIDQTQIDQILVNLCVNAKDAITHSKGKITIETSTVVIDQEYCDEHIDLLPGEFIQLTVSDNGCGIDKESLKQIYDPFFTSKRLGHGTGLGLSTVHGIVKQNNGFINVYSEQDMGTTFKVYLPSSTTEHVESIAKIVKRCEGNKTKTILLVEDDPSLLFMAKKMLEGIGYTVKAASGPIEALDISLNHSGDIHLIFTDVVMPEMTSKEMVHQITLHHPKAKSLFTSGYTASVITNNGIIDEGIQFIQKPYSTSDLAHKVKRILS